MARNQISSVAFGQVNSAVRILPGASVNVVSASGGPVTLYAGEDGSETVSNPFICDALGRYEFFVSSSEISYTITVTLGPVSYTWVFYTPDNTAAAGLIYEETWADLVGRSANLDGAAAEVTNDAGTHLAATDSGYDGGEVANLGRYRWNESWGRWERLDDLSPAALGQPYESEAALEASSVPATIASVLVAVDDAVLRYVRSDDPADIQSADGKWWARSKTPIIAGGTGADTASGAREALGVCLTSNLTVYVPTDYPTVQDAIEGLEHLNPSGFRITIMIESGTVISGGFAVYNGDYSHFTVSSEDAVVLASATNIVRTGRSPSIFSTVGSFAWAENAAAPKWDILVDAQNTGPEDIKGITIFGPNASLDVSGGCGLINLGDRANLGGAEPSQYGYGLLVWNGATARINGAVFTGSAQRNLWVSRNASVTAAAADLSGSLGEDGVNPQDNGNHGNVYVTRGSWANLEYANLSGAANRGAMATRSYMNLEAADCSGCAGASIGADRGAWVNAYETRTNTSPEGAAPYTPQTDDLVNITEFNYLTGSGYIACAQQSSWPIRTSFTSNGVNCIAVRHANGDYEIYSAEVSGATATYNTANELRAPQIDFPVSFIDTTFMRTSTVMNPSDSTQRGVIGSAFFGASVSSIIPAAQSNGLFGPGDTCQVYFYLKGRWK